mgnify:CR=1 FL=1
MVRDQCAPCEFRTPSLRRQVLEAGHPAGEPVLKIADLEQLQARRAAGFNAAELVFKDGGDEPVYQDLEGECAGAEEL